MRPQYGLISMVAIALVAGDVDFNGLVPQNLVGGRAARDNEFPYMVGLRENGDQICGGVILDPRHVLTAAHCVADLSSPYNAMTAATGSVWADEGQLHDIKSITTHFRYNKSDEGSPYDIAIIVLKQNITFNSHQKNVAISHRPVPSGAVAIAAGWGYLHEAATMNSYYLKKIYTSVLSYERCFDYLEPGAAFNKDSQICSHAHRGIGVCYGDSGGPLVYNDILIGITTHTYGCGHGYADIFANVSYFAPWIREKIAETYKSEADLHVALDGEFPYMVSLRQNGNHICGGAILDARHVLTAAHCVGNFSSPYNAITVAMGSVWRDAGQLHDIKSITTHFRFNKANRLSTYDIAIIVLKEKIIFNDNQTSVALSERRTPSDVITTKVGWGRTNAFVRLHSPYLMKINTTILDHERCLASVDQKDRKEIHQDYHICGLSPNEIGACIADSGSPLVYDGTLIGISSFTFHECALEHPEVYINVSEFVPWIRHNIAETYRMEEDLHVSDAYAGVKYRRYFVGGLVALDMEFPYMVSLRENGNHICGGAILDARHVLTAAHCVNHPSFQYATKAVAMGSICKDQGQLHDIKSIKTHFGFNKSNPLSEYDIAIIVLKENIIFNDHQKNVTLSHGPIPRWEIATVAGWGQEYTNGTTTTSYLRKMINMILSYEECLQHLEKGVVINVDSEICSFSQGGIGPCIGESGSPLVYNGTLIGIVTNMYACAQGYADIYANVSYFVPWIRQQMANTYKLEDPNHMR